MKKLLPLLAFAMLCAFATGVKAQTTPYTVTVSWTLPPQDSCQNGSPIINCPVTGYRLERQSGTAWVDQKTVGPTVLSTTMPAALGTNVYRGYALSNGFTSPPSSNATRVIDTPKAITITITIVVDANGDVVVTRSP